MDKKINKNVEVDLPSVREAGLAFEPGLQAHLQTLQTVFRDLQAWPQVLLLEGGQIAERLSLGLWIAAKLNCQQASRPCLQCPTCLQIGAQIFNDLYVLNGQEGSIKIETIRELKPILGQAPRGNGVRVVILAEAQALGIEAANSLLKVLEEPKEKLLFLLLTSQRERLLPTLISRSWCLTLPWPLLTDHKGHWENILCQFFDTGQGLFEHTAGKGNMTPQLAQEIILILQKFLVYTVRNLGNQTNLNLIPKRFSQFNSKQILQATELIANAQQALEYMVNPSLVLHGLAVQLAALPLKP